MGLIKAIAGAAGGVMADQWKEYFYCEAMPANILATKGHKKVTGRSSNYKGDENIITNGSMIAVADGQCMLIVEQGKVVEVCAEPGEFLYDTSTEPSIFSGKLGDGIGDVFRNIGKRFTFGGEAPKDQRVYYFNTKELIGNKYGTASPVPFRVVDQRAAIDIDVGIRCFGEYSYHIANPLLFYTNVCGNVSEDYDRSNLDSQLKTELLTALQPAFAKISEMGIRYSALPGHTVELADALNEALSAKWRDLRGIEVVSFGVSSVTANEEDEKMIKEMQRNAAFMDPTRAAAHLAGATGDAMKTAAANPNGAVGAFMGMGMAGGMAGAQMGTLYQQGAQISSKRAEYTPILHKGTCMIPIQTLSEVMNCDVNYNEQNLSVQISKGEDVLRFQLDDDRYYFNDVRFNTAVKPVLLGGMVYVPFRAWAERFGYQVAWNPKTSEVAIGNDLDYKWYND